MTSRGTWREPRRLAFHALTILAVLVCVAAARWQWQRAHRTEADAVPDVPAVALATLDPQSAFSGMRVRLTGTFDVEHEALVEPRRRSGEPGAWVLTPLLPSPGTDGGAAGAPTTAVAVVRGWIPAGQAPAAPPAGEVSVDAVLVADSRAAQPQVTAGDPPTMTAVDTGAMATIAGYPVRSGWFALQSMTPAGLGQPAPLRVTELPGAEVGLNWRNAAYAAQWVAFAAFAVFFWNRFRRDLDRSTQGSTA